MHHCPHPSLSTTDRHWPWFGFCPTGSSLSLEMCDPGQGSSGWTLVHSKGRKVVRKQALPEGCRAEWEHGGDRASGLPGGSELEDDEARCSWLLPQLGLAGECEAFSRCAWLLHGWHSKEAKGRS